MSIFRAVNRPLGALSAILSFAAGAFTAAGADDHPARTPRPIVHAAAQPDTAPNYADFSLPLAACFTVGQQSDRREMSVALDSRTVARATRDEFSGVAMLSYEPGRRGGHPGNWTPQSRRERSELRFEHNDFVARTYYDAKRLAENLTEWVHLDRSYLNDLELQETSYGTRLKQDAHDVRSVLSLQRVSVILPLYQRGLTAVSLEFNADKLYRAAKGDVPQLRGGLRVRF
jgi:hypothetical protein